MLHNIGGTIPSINNIYVISEGIILPLKHIIYDTHKYQKRIKKLKTY